MKTASLHGLLSDKLENGFVTRGRASLAGPIGNRPQDKILPRVTRAILLLMVAPLFCIAAPPPADWVPARWSWSDAKSLDLLEGSPINCLLLESYSAEFAAAATKRGLVTLAVVAPQEDVPGAAHRALDAGLTGIVLEGEFAAGVPAKVKAAAGAAPVVEISTRSRILLAGDAPILATWQGLWPGIAVQEDGAKRAGPSGSAWIDTNTGFLRAVHAWGSATIWIANRPPAGTIVTGRRYEEAIADAAASGARWVVALDADFAKRLARRDADAASDFRRINSMLRYFERHPEWRQMRTYGQLAIVQDPAKGGLLSGGILDMIAVKHTPVEPVPSQHLSAEALRDATLVVNVEGNDLTPEQKEILRGFARGGGTLLTAPPDWKDKNPGGDKITIDKAELDRLGDIWREVNSMIGRRNLGVRLFNVSSMLSNVLASADGKTEVVQLVNYSDYPVENVSVHLLGEFHHAALTTPEGVEKTLELYQTDEGWGVDLDRVSVCATIKLEK